MSYTSPHDVLLAVGTFLLLVFVALGTLVASERLPERYRHEDTINLIRLAANIFVVASSLVLGLLINSAKNSFEAVNRNVHVFATDLILLDRTLRQYGPEASVARQHLAAYLRRAIDGTWRASGPPTIEDRVAESHLNDVGRAIGAIKPSDPARAELWREAQANYQEVVKQRWVLIGESDGTIPGPFLVMLVTWLTLIFATYGYRAPRNAVVATTLVVAALLLSGSIYLIIDMDNAFFGSIQISPAPLERALEQMQR